MIAVTSNLRTTETLRRLRLAAGIALLALCAGHAAAQSGPLEDLSAFPSGKLTISDVKMADGKKGKLEYTVWLADTPQRMAQGLMFVRSLPAMRGMLFVHPEPRSISMWMKNTYIPLDMVFIDARGRIQQIIEKTQPHSLQLIQSSSPARAVLEIAGGEASRLGLHTGQQVTHPALASH
jgi:uncharacterized protein